MTMVGRREEATRGFRWRHGCSDEEQGRRIWRRRWWGARGLEAAALAVDAAARRGVGL
jgi:hypothetical protein